MFFPSSKFNAAIDALLAEHLLSYVELAPRNPYASSLGGRDACRRQIPRAEDIRSRAIHRTIQGGAAVHAAQPHCDGISAIRQGSASRFLAQRPQPVRPAREPEEDRESALHAVLRQRHRRADQERLFQTDGLGPLRSEAEQAAGSALIR